MAAIVIQHGAVSARENGSVESPLAVLVTGSPYPDGDAAARRVALWADSLRDAGLRVKVLVLSSEQGRHQPEPTEARTGGDACGLSDVEVFEVRPSAFWLKRQLTTLKAHARLAKRVRSVRGGATVLFSFLQSFTAVLALHRAALACGCAFVTERTEYPLLGDEGRTWWRRLETRLLVRSYRRFDVLIGITSNLSRVLQRAAGRRTRILTVPAVVDLSEFRAPRERGRPPVILYFGDGSAEKDGFEDILEAFERVLKSVPEARLKVAGRASRMLTRPLPERLSGRVDRLGWLSRRELVRAMSAARCLVVAKRVGPQGDYCMPSKVAEYLASGTPVVLTRVGVLAEALEREEAAVVCPAGDPESLSAALTRILSDTRFAESVGARGREFAEAHLDHRRAGRALLFTLSRTAGPGQGAAVWPHKSEADRVLWDGAGP